GERSSSTEVLMRYGGFGFTGLLYLVFAGALAATLPGGMLLRVAAALIALEGIGRIGAGVFPCNTGCAPVAQGPNLHALFATIGFVSGVLATFLWAWLFRRVEGLRVLTAFSVACGTVALLSLSLM